MLSRSLPETAEIFRPRSARKSNPRRQMGLKISLQGVGKCTFCPVLGCFVNFCRLIIIVDEMLLRLLATYTVRLFRSYYNSSSDGRQKGLVSL